MRLYHFNLLLFILFTGTVMGAASYLPDISVIGDMAVQTSNREDDPDDDKLSIREIELAFQGYLYPNIRADVFLAMHRHEGVMEPEVCEAAVSFFRLFFDGLSLKAGKIHVNFGKINKIHQHERPYVDQPLVITNFLGHHGLVGEGAALGYLPPLPFFLQLEGGAWSVAGGHHHDGDGEEEAPEFGLADQVFTGRIWSSFPLGGEAELEIGGSFARGSGSHFEEHRDKVMLGGADMTLKWWPSTFQRLILQVEWLSLMRKVPVGDLERNGFYVYTGFQFNKYLEAGLRFDQSDNAFPGSEIENLVSGITAWRLTETTKIRAQAGYSIEAEIYTAFLQLVFGIGPHTHPLQ